jgi:hypothetical protein
MDALADALTGASRGQLGVSAGRFGYQSPKPKKQSSGKGPSATQMWATLKSPEERKAYAAQLKAAKDAKKALRHSQFRDLAGKARDELQSESDRIRQIENRAERNSAAKARLWGNAPLSHLLSGQRRVLPNSAFKTKRVPPQVAVQVAAIRNGGKDWTATKCAGVIQAAKEASKYTFNERTIPYIMEPGSPRAKALLKAWRHSGSITPERYQALKAKWGRGGPGEPEKLAALQRIRSQRIPPPRARRNYEFDNAPDESEDEYDE